MSPLNWKTPAGRKRLIFLVAGIAILSGMSWAFGLLGRSEAESEYFTQPVSRGPLQEVVDATGTLQTLVTVQVGSQVSGQILALYADYNSVVKRGQLLARIDPRNFEAQLENSKANLTAAEAHVQALQAALLTQKADLASAQANLAAAAADRDNNAAILKRNSELLGEGLVTQNDFDAVKAGAETSAARYRQAAAAIEVAQAQITAAGAELKQAEAQVLQARADLNSKQISLAYTSIYSPVDGVVISRNVDAGQTVAASLQAPLLFVIANDLSKMQVNASVDEADIGNISRAARVRFTVDAYPNRTFTGTIGEIRLNPQTVQSVVTYSVIINVDNSSLALRPGMTANITFTVEERGDAVRIPNAALRYSPPGAAPGPVKSLLMSAEGSAARGPLRDGPARSSTPAASARSFVDSPPEAPGQLWNPAEKIQFAEAKPPDARQAVVWVLDSAGKPAPRAVRLGISDGTFTEEVAGSLKVGERVIVADGASGPADPARPAATMPFGFGGRGGGRR